MSNPILTADGSHTLFNEKTGEHYHSTFGAITESEHIFIQAGLGAIPKERSKLGVLEIGLGTGLNALLTLRWAEENDKPVSYHAIEAFPLEQEVIKKLNYTEVLGINQDKLLAIHAAQNEIVQISAQFSFSYSQVKLEDANFPDNQYEIVFYDAFSPDVQAEMWTEVSFRKIFKSMKNGGILTTYSCKGIVKRALKASGFQIEKLPGPPGKREFLRARKIEV